jgi:hypothetical protein
LGSHRWAKNRGNLTINPKVNPTNKTPALRLFDRLLATSALKSVNLTLKKSFLKAIKHTRSGREANTVYKNKLILAERRSG